MTGARPPAEMDESRPRPAPDRATEAFRAQCGGEPALLVRAPGRVNLIGEHTDYNEGFVLPMAIDRAVWIALRPRKERRVAVHAVDFGESVDFGFPTIEKGGPAWGEYVKGVAWSLIEAGHTLAGWEGVVAGDVPIGAGLSSSAALEVAAARAFAAAAGLAWEPLAMARITRRAENDWVGVPCGIMDQFISALGRAGHALFLDCRDLSYRHVPLRGDVKVVVCNTGIKRALAQSEYEVRLKQCNQAVAQLKTVGLAIKNLRDVDPEDLDTASDALSEILLRRARHVVTENARVLEAVKVLEEGDLERFGELMNASHESLRDDYEVSSKELDVLVELAWKQPGTLGARMTGAGFGGCTVNLVRADAADAFAEAVKRGYQETLSLKAEIYVCQASDGALAGTQ